MDFRHLPLFIHDRAERAAQSLECAGEQHELWRMHDALFEKPAMLRDEDFSAHARVLGLELDRFERCMSGPNSRRIQDDIELAGRLGLTSTPSFVVGRGAPDGTVIATDVIIGARPVNDFASAVERALRER